MLVIASDLHLTDGTSGETIRAGAFRVFQQRLRDVAYDASKRADGTYKPIERIDILLLGDILDVIRSTQWLNAKVRPWDDLDSTDQRDKLFKLVDKITRDILKHNDESLGILRDLSNPKVKSITLPPQDPDDPTKAKAVRWEPGADDRVPVKVQIHYMVGNHDWFFYRDGEEYNELRKEVVKKMGLANDPNVRFPHDPDESKAITKLQRDHEVFARHGDLYDSFNYQPDEGRDASSLGDAIVIELLNRFPFEVKKELDGEIPDSIHDGLRELDNVRPLTMIPVWIEGLLNRCGADGKQRAMVKQVWNRLADEFLDLPFVRERDRLGFDAVDKLEFALKFSKLISIARATRAINRSRRRRAAATYRKFALTERDFKNRRARFIVYGHTHAHEVVPLDISGSADAGEIRQVYVNSGTWRRVHERAVGDLKAEEFVPYNVMTYLAFFKDGERRGRPFEAWSGSMGVS